MKAALDTALERLVPGRVEELHTLDESVAVMNTFDPLAYGGSLALALAACIAAAWIPSRRAARVDPLETLRHD